MRIADVLRNKGPAVVTVDPEMPVSTLIGELARHNVGALVVTENDAVVGIVTERDVVRRIHERGPDILNARVVDIMTTSVFACLPTDTVDSLAETMTERRIRHLPVIVDGQLVGIVSIGDVVKSRIGELQTERDQLESYIDHG
ncbi:MULTISPECIES: CBS domain-containing protein [Rhodococcus]|jgi:CBS domain-containing protein|uniref:IMP dehydrogenase n=4 Tax=Rhodococcus TaxID=1827 RepID=A0AB38F549_RHOWR|nr:MULTISPECIES: CBS domain-containing protein [Rhodococcus]AII03733.1 histidine kinase [Rhodococcus opacus]EJJ01981.1 CBS domain pair family protein [Rhodococcus sp. JVH1]MDH6292511.1 CBS domain-containing protein [Rhodococcus opacus]MDI9950529.1 CBS domain-containing protein [Rhodococcus sp. IEGM 1305]MDI9974746.1 CBS domain-containing protein [Rhodococcus sp. IEGM 1307]